VNSRERFLEALAGKQADRVAIADYVASGSVFEAMIGRRPKFRAPCDLVQVALALGFDAVHVAWGGCPLTVPDGIVSGLYQNEWGVTYQVDPSTYSSWPIEYSIKSLQDLEGFEWPDPAQGWRLDRIKRGLELCNGRIALFSELRGPFAHTAWHLIGLVPTLLAIYDAPALLATAFRMITDFNLEIAHRLVETGVDALMITEDLGTTLGPLLSPKHYREMILPYLRELVDGIRSLGVPVILHSDGNIGLFLDDLIATGISALHPIQRSAGMDLRDTKQKYGDYVCLWGNVAIQTLSHGSPEAVEREVRECIRVAAPGGGYILASELCLLEGVPVANVLKMIEAAKKWGQYPIQEGG
jgi:uroporphyrinogen decarboxylase